MKLNRPISIGGNFRLQDESGAALLLVIMLMVILSMLSLFQFELIQTSTQISGNQRLDLRATYIAEAGIEEGMNALRNNPGIDDGVTSYPLHDSAGGPDGDDETFHLGGGIYRVTLEDRPRTGMSVYDEADITGTGTVLGQTRAIKVHIKIVPIVTSGGFAVSTTSWELL